MSLVGSSRSRDASSQRKKNALLSIACLLAIILVLNLETINWWFGPIDSPLVLIQVLLYSPLEYFGSPYEYQLLTASNLTPWVTFSWEIDYALFQLDASGYRAHHLMSFVLMVALIYLILFRLTGSLLNTSIFCLAIATTPSTFDVVDFLVARHYLEGMIFCLLSFYLASLYNEKGKVAWLFLSVFFYGLSTTAKEVYVPLPGILFFLYSGGFRQRVKLMIPYALITLAYFVWRSYMLGGSMGGYGSFSAILELLGSPSILAEAAFNVVGSLFVNWVASVLLLSLFLLLLVLNFQRLSWMTRMGLLVGAWGLVLPLIVLLPMISEGVIIQRWFFLPVVTLLLFLAYLCSITASRAISRFVYLVVLVVSSVSVFARMAEPTPIYVSGREFYSKILDSDPGAYIRTEYYGILLSVGISNWVYLTKLQTGSWGTLVISNPGQFEYHDTEGMLRVTPGYDFYGEKDLDETKRTGLELIKRSSHDADTGVLEFDFVDGLSSEGCFVYVFGENNGVLFRIPECRRWGIRYKGLERISRGMGYGLADVYMAVWSDRTSDRFHSKPYKMESIIDLSVH